MGPCVEVAKNVKGNLSSHVGDTTLDKLKMGVAVPATAFLDQEGHIVARIMGEMRQGEIEERLNWLLGNQTGPAPAALVKHLEGK